jgi:hypothetical protein
MNDELITIIAFVVIALGIGWYMWPKQKVEEPKLDPIPEPAPAPVVEEVKPAPVASLEPVVVPEPVVETPAPAPEPVVEAPVVAPKAKKPAVKKEKTFVPAAAPKPKAPAKKAPAKKVTKK